MVGEMSVIFVIHGVNGKTVELNRVEANRLLLDLTRVLKETGPSSAAKRK
jgi:hypothetical protein